MKNIIVILFVFFFLLGCDKENNNDCNYCDVENPLNELVWLKEIVNEQTTNHLNKMIIKKYEYDNIQGFLVNYCVGCADGSSIFYDCSGIEFCSIGGVQGSNSCSDFLENSIEGEIIFVDTIVQIKPVISIGLGTALE